MIRKRLDNRRLGDTIDCYLGGLKVVLSTGEYPDGNLGEIFSFLHPNCDGLQIPNSSYEALLSAFCTVVSIGLQYGVPLEVYLDQFVGTRFEPSGLVVGHEKIKMSSSILDLIFRELGIRYLGQAELGNIQ